MACCVPVTLIVPAAVCGLLAACLHLNFFRRYKAYRPLLRSPHQITFPFYFFSEDSSGSKTVQRSGTLTCPRYRNYRSVAKCWSLYAERSLCADNSIGTRGHDAYMAAADEPHHPACSPRGIYYYVVCPERIRSREPWAHGTVKRTCTCTSARSPIVTMMIGSAGHVSSGESSCEKG